MVAKMEKKNLKYTKTPNSVSTKLRMFLTDEARDYRINSKYIDMLCPEPDDKVSSTEKLNQIIEEALVKEFSEKIKNSPNFHLLVDAVAHRLKKNSLREE